MSWSATNPSANYGTSFNTDPELDVPLMANPNVVVSVSSVSPSIETSPTSNNFADHHALNTTLATESNLEANKERATVPSACVQCRSKHLKCDGTSPCRRCLTNNLECAYVRSRRGFKGPRKNGLQNKGSPVSATLDARSCPLIDPLASARSTSVSSGLVTPPENRLPNILQFNDQALFDPNQDVVSLPSNSGSLDMSLAERCIEAYFYYFHAGHPVVVPRGTFMRLRIERNLSHLEAAMRYAGSFFVKQANTLALGAEAERLLYQSDCPKDAFRVQALLIMCVASDGHTDQDKALRLLVAAQDQALEIGMNRREFASMASEGSAILAESFRRTWWELFIVDGMIAGVHQKSDFRMMKIIADVALPCEEIEYATGKIPICHSLEDFDGEGFDVRNITYSSYTYRIAAIRNLGHVLAATRGSFLDEDTIDRLDARLVTWRLHLPDTKQNFINKDEQLDEMLFQAYMITEATTLMLHREHSQLDSEIAKSITACAPHKEILAGESFNIHAAKTINAAKGISKLIQLPAPLVKHTHFFTCVVTLASVVHLTCWSAMDPLTYDDDLKQQLRLSTGSLKTLWQVWPAAGKAFGQVKGVAQEMYANKKQAIERGYWGTFTSEEIVRGLVEDQGIMNELQLLT